MAVVATLLAHQVQVAGLGVGAEGPARILVEPERVVREITVEIRLVLLAQRVVAERVVQRPILPALRLDMQAVQTVHPA